MLKVNVVFVSKCKRTPREEGDVKDKRRKRARRVGPWAHPKIEGDANHDDDPEGSMNVTTRSSHPPGPLRVSYRHVGRLRRRTTALTEAF